MHASYLSSGASKNSHQLHNVQRKRPCINMGTKGTPSKHLPLSILVSSAEQSLKHCNHMAKDRSQASIKETYIHAYLSVICKSIMQWRNSQQTPGDTKPLQKSRFAQQTRRRGARKRMPCRGHNLRAFRQVVYIVHAQHADPDIGGGIVL